MGFDWRALARECYRAYLNEKLIAKTTSKMIPFDDLPEAEINAWICAAKHVCGIYSQAVLA